MTREEALRVLEAEQETDIDAESYEVLQRLRRRACEVLLEEEKEAPDEPPVDTVCARCGMRGGVLLPTMEQNHGPAYRHRDCMEYPPKEEPDGPS